MRTDYTFSNLLGGIYTRGDMLFTPSTGLSLLSPIANRVAVYDLSQNSAATLPFEAKRNITAIDLTEDEQLLAFGDDKGNFQFVFFPSAVLLEQKRIALPIIKLKFSPNGKFLAILCSDALHVSSTPSDRTRCFNSTHIIYSGNLTSELNSVTWSPNSDYLVINGEETLIRLREPQGKLRERVIPCGKIAAVNTWFESDNRMIVVLRSRGICILNGTAYNEDLDEQKKQKVMDILRVGQVKKDKWNSIPQWYTMLWTHKTYTLPDGGVIRSADYNKQTKILACGFKDGFVGIYRIPDKLDLESGSPIVCLQYMSISEQSINTVALNKNGNLIAFGSSKLGQLLVWDLSNETYVLRQQSHTSSDINCVSYSHDGTMIATGGDDGKVKVWKGTHGFCFATFRDHTAAIIAMKFNQNHALFTASLDGTVRAYDLVRYRMFRVFTTPQPVQFTCLDLDPSGELLACGCSDPFSIYIWSVKTGRILEVLDGHEGPISSISFNPQHNILASAGWDKAVRIWAVATSEERSKAGSESLINLSSEILCITFNNVGDELCAVTLTGKIEFFDCQDMSDIKITKSGIDASNDIQGGHRTQEVNATFSRNAGRYINSVSYSPNDQTIICAGNTKWVTLYHPKERVLLSKWAVTNNESLDGVAEAYDWRSISEAGNVNLIDDEDSDEDGVKVMKLPGVLKGRVATGKRNVLLTARCKQVCFSPNGREWAAASTTGLVIFSLDGSAASFRPVRLSYNLTPDAVYEIIKSGNYTEALVSALQLNEAEVLKAVICSVPSNEIEFVCRHLPPFTVASLFGALSREISKGHHLEFCLRWIVVLLVQHSSVVERSNLQSELKEIQRAIINKTSSLTPICDANQYTMEYLVQVARHSSNHKKVDNTNKLIEDTQQPIEEVVSTPPDIPISDDQTQKKKKDKIKKKKNQPKKETKKIKKTKRSTQDNSVTKKKKKLKLK